MGKYSDIVKGKKRSDPADSQSAKERAPIESAKPENQKTGYRENKITNNAENIKAREPDDQKALSEDMVNLSIKVPRRLRQKWVAESRLRGTTLTAIISDYLKAELGE